MPNWKKDIEFHRELEKCATGAYKNKLPIRVVITYIYTSNKYY